MSEYPQAIWREMPCAKKNHLCCECAGEIKVGEVYEKVRGVWCGEASSYKTCFECSEMRKDVDKGRHFDEHSCFTLLHEDIFESREVSLISRFLMNKKNRAADIPAWMWQRLDDLSKPESETFYGETESGTIVMKAGEES